MSIFKNSRYEDSKVYKLNNEYHIGIRKILEKKNFEDNIIHTVVEGERFDSIANTYWGRPELFYIICDWNDIFDPIFELTTGMQLTLPSYKTILEEKIWT